MKRIYLTIIACWAMLVASAQKLTVESMTVAGNDISASQYRVNDLNGQPCTLVKVQLATRGAKFAGSVIGMPQFKNGVYWVYMPAGVKELEVQHNSFVPCHVTFSDYGIQSLQSLTTYVLTLLMPQGGAAPVQMQKLVINYAPATATVLIDSKFYKGSGRVEAMLPVGSHDYIIAADGYATAEGSVKLTTDGSRTINETLTAIVATQQTVGQQISVQQSNNVQLNTATQSTSSSSSSVSGAAVETITANGVSFNMVRVEGGTFTMGATPEQEGDANNDEKPAHKVTLSTYSIGETEVTQALWQAVMGSNPSKYKGDDLPVANVSWDDCQEFVQKLNMLTGKHFRLPTEAEWEFAARGGNKSHGYKYCGSNNIADVAWCDEPNDDGTHAVKSKQPNELGLYDMSGNAWEWCQDKYGSYSSNSQYDPTGSSSGSIRVDRGGGWCNIPKTCRVSSRSNDSPSAKYAHLGLRLALQ